MTMMRENGLEDLFVDGLIVHFICSSISLAMALVVALGIVKVMLYCSIVAEAEAAQHSKCKIQKVALKRE